MLSSLHIRNYVLIDSLDVDFPEGLVIITGQTGAGKSILLGALSLLTGAKADASVIMEGADSCVVEAEFDVDDADGTIKDILEDNDADWGDGHLIIRRVVNASGRSRSFVNDSPVQVGVLSALSSHLVDVHSQHQSLLLTDHSYQLSVLDHYAGNLPLLNDCRDTFRKLQALKAELHSQSVRLSMLEREKDYNEAQLRQLEDARIRPGELDELEIEQKQLSNAEQIRESLSSARDLLEGGQVSGVSVSSAFKDAAHRLDRISEFVPAAGQLSERVESCRIELEDVLSEVGDIFESVNVSEDRLQQVEDRMSLIYSLYKKFGCASEDELLAARDAFSEALFDSASLEDSIAGLKEEIGSLEKRYAKLSEALHQSRLNASAGFSQCIQDSVRFLELDKAVFSVELSGSAPSQTGCDSVSYVFSSTGKNPADVSKCASGGEISRIMLCLKALMAKYAKMPTMIFDEIDTGVSGSVADKMGSMICSMGNDMQVFAITHLPQVAAKGKAHYLVSKQEGERTTSSIRLLDKESRVLELARMLSGSTVTEAAIANAKSLLFQ